MVGIFRTRLSRRLCFNKQDLGAARGEPSAPQLKGRCLNRGKYRAAGEAVKVVG